MPLPWRPHERRAILDRYFALLPQAEEDPEASLQLSALSQKYVEGLPRLLLSRCPFTKFELRHSFDPYGLDGLWWNYHDPARPLRERIYTCQAITGAVTLVQPVEVFPFLAKPGPGIPYVLPHLLQAPDVLAVLSTLACGRHTAYCVAYYAPDERDGLNWPNDWGANERWAEGGNSPGAGTRRRTSKNPGISICGPGSIPASFCGSPPATIAWSCAPAPPAAHT